MKIGHCRGTVEKSKSGPGEPGPYKGRMKSGPPSQTARRVGHPGILFGFVGEGEFGFFVQDQGTEETVGGASAGDVDSYGENAGHALLEVVDVGGRRRGRESVFVFLAAVDLREFCVDHSA